MSKLKNIKVLVAPASEEFRLLQKMLYVAAGERTVPRIVSCADHLSIWQTKHLLFLSMLSCLAFLHLQTHTERTVSEFLENNVFVVDVACYDKCDPPYRQRYHSLFHDKLNQQDIVNDLHRTWLARVWVPGHGGGGRGRGRGCSACYLRLITAQQL